MDAAAILNEARLIAAAGGVLGPMSTQLLVDAVTPILRENKELRDRLWQAERAWHNSDPWETEAEDA
jgi:hypothetical protein